MTEVELKQRTKQFALRIIKLIRALPRTTEGRAIAAQLVRSGTSEQVQPLHQEACELTAIMAASRISAASSQIANLKSRHSLLSASIGSTRAARRAGSQQANKATPVSANATPKKVAGSVAFTE